MAPRYEIHAESGVCECGIRFFLVLRDPEKRKVLKVFEPTLEKMEEPSKEGYGFPSFTIEEGEAQRLVNQLWDAGVRPTAAKGSAGQLEAVKYHLEDMRKLVSVKVAQL